MLQTSQTTPRPSRSSNLAEAFSRTGWFGFWMQIVVGSVPLLLAIYAFTFGRNTGVARAAAFG
jgi:Protein of unknown function (DUF3611)